MRTLILILFMLPCFAAAFPVQRCVNLDHALEAPNEGDWGFVIQESHIQWIANQGFDTIRLPVRFDAHWVNDKLNPDILARVDEVIGWAFDADLKVILDLHHFQALMRDPAKHSATFLAIWSELAQHYAEYDNRLIFELLNEPGRALDSAGAMALFREAYPIIRRTNPDRWIVIEGAPWANMNSLPDLARIDTRTALSFHYYRPSEFTHQQAGWMDNPHPARGWGRAREKAAVSRDFEQAAEFGLPMLLGEFGAIGKADLTARLRWTRTVRKAAEDNGISWCHWGLARNFAIMDAATHTWLPGMRVALMD